MAWDDDKSTAGDPDNPSADEQLTADEYDAMVADQKAHSGRHEAGGVDEVDVTGLSGDLADAQDPKSHGNAAHSETYATTTEVDGKADDPHSLGGGAHGADTLANLNSKVSDATLDDSGDSRPPESHGNAAHSETFVSDGDGTTRQIWVIANGASDPAGAGPEDIIFEEES